MRFELTHPNGHYPLKVARLPIPPPAHKDIEVRHPYRLYLLSMEAWVLIVPGTGIEPARHCCH